MKRGNFYWKEGVTVFLTVAAILLFYDTMFGQRVAQSFFGTLAGALSPIVYGAMIAYLLAPIIDFWERLLFREPISRDNT